MAYNLNVASCCGTRGGFPVGTGDAANYQSNFVTSVVVPKNDDGTVKEGYTLSSSNDATSGLDWRYTGANGKTIQTYQFPDNCPIPFPSPEELSTDLVLITREDYVSKSPGSSGLVDLYMPTVGIQGNVPRHSIPSLADVTNQVVFYFDDANAAINVYNVGTRTWRMGWVRAVTDFGFKWRAADLLTPQQIRTTGGAYTAPYNAAGLFFSCVSSQFTNQVNQTVALGNNQPGFYFINYTVANETIVAWDTTTAFYRPYGGTSAASTVQDLFVTAINVLDQKNALYYTSGDAASGVGNVTKEFVAAVAVGNNSDLTNKTYGWWGFLARTGTGDPVFVNPDMSWATGASAVTTPYPNFAFYETVGVENEPRGFVQTISLDPKNDIFFIGGNYSHIRFQAALKERSWQATDGTKTQISAVAMQFKFSRYNIPTAGAVRPTLDSYQWIGGNALLVADVRNWTGRITQSNYADECFAYGGTFLTPPSKIVETATSGYAPGNDNTGNPYIVREDIEYVAPLVIDNIVTPFAQFPVPQRVQGGYLDSISILFDNAAPYDQPFNVGTNVSTLNNVCIGFAPSNGDIRESTFAPAIISGNFLNPRPIFFSNFSIQTYQTQNTIIGTNWWYSSVEIYVADDSPEVNYCGYLYPDNVFSYLDAPIQFTGKTAFKKGTNIIPILGGGAVVNTATNPPTGGGIYYNSNLTVATKPALDNVPRAFFFTITFTDDDGQPSNSVYVQLNGANLKRWPGVWKLYGFPLDNITLDNNPGLFSSVALSNANYATQTILDNSPTDQRRILTYKNIREVVPQLLITYSVFIIPINWEKTRATYGTYKYLAPSDNGASIVQATFKQDRQGDFDSSVLNLCEVPDVVYAITNMNSAGSVLPSFSFYMNSKYEIYKTGWALSDKIAFGIFTNFQEVSDLQITVMPNGTNVTGEVNVGKAAFSDASHNLLVINRYNTVGAPLSYTNILGVGDVIYISDFTAQRGYYQVTGVPVQPTGQLTAEVPVAYVSGYNLWGNDPASPGVQTLFNYVLSRNARQTPFVLQESFGPYVIGNGSSPDTVRDVYLSSYDATGKAYRYVPNWQNSFLQFSDYVKLAVGAQTADDTVLCDTITFNSNTSSVLLSRGAPILGGPLVPVPGLFSQWNLVSKSGNVGFNNQSTV